MVSFRAGNLRWLMTLTSIRMAQRIRIHHQLFNPPMECRWVPFLANTFLADTV